MKHIGLKRIRGAAKREGVAQRVQAARGLRTGPGEERVGGCGGIRVRDEADGVAGGAIVPEQSIHDALDAAVADGRHGNHRIGGEENAHVYEAEA